MESLEAILQPMIGRISTQNGNSFLNKPLQKELNYVESYTAPNNPIRLHDEAHGVTLVIGEDEVPRFEADPEIFFADCPATLNGVPTFFQNRRFEHFRPEYYSAPNHGTAREVLKIAQRYVQRFDEIIKTHRGCGLYLWSRERGSGKTFLASILGNSLAEAGKRVVWYSMPELLRSIKASFDKDSYDRKTDEVERAQRAEVLILDDIGSEKKSEWVNETMFLIVDERLKTCRPTIFTANAEPDNLGYDPRISDRIASATLDLHLPEERVRRLVASAGKEQLRKQLGA